MSNNRVEVVLHRHGRETSDITPLVTRLTWTRSISAPWHSLTVEWKTTVKDAFARVAVGDWVAVRAVAGSVSNSSQRPVLAFCHIDNISSGAVMNSNGNLATTEVTLSCSSWWNLLQQVNLYSPLGWTEDIGTLLSMQSWSKVAGSIAQDYTTGSLAAAFKKLFTALAVIKLPETVAGGKTLAELIPLVHDVNSRDTYAPSRTVESVDIGGGLPNRIGTMLGAYQSSIGEIFNGTFVPEPLLIELFPSFERYANTATSTPTSQASGQTDDTLATFLGGWETLLYRIKPFRNRALRESAVAWSSYTHVNIEKVVQDGLKPRLDALDPATQLARGTGLAAGLEGAAQTAQQLNAENQALVNDLDTNMILSNVFKEDTWGYTTAKFIEKRMVRRIDFNRSDTPRLNAASIVLSPDPSSGIEALKPFGLPITYDEEIRRHGLRVLKPSWTFVVADPEAVGGVSQSDASRMSLPRNGPNFVSYMRTICAQFMQFYKNNHLFATGTLSLNFLDAIEKKTDTRGTFFDKVLDLKAGETFVVALNDTDDLFYSYAETITHTFAIVDGGVEMASTSVNYTRGHFGVSDDALIKEVQVPMRQTVAAAPTVGSFRRQSGPVAAPPVGCAAGIPYGSAWPTSLPDVLSKEPAWLRPWAKSRGLRIPRGVLGGDTEQYLVVTAACAFIIEKYWQVKFPAAHIYITSAYIGRDRDASDNHKGGHAIDFSISLGEPHGFGSEKVAVLQSWAALRKLADAKRIPPGGRGLYLNVSPTGVKGVLPTGTDPGEASLTKRGGVVNTASPRGGSAGTHYDHRGAFGYTARTAAGTALAPQKYVWCDSIGEGKDNYATGVAGLPDAATYLRNNLEAVFVYYGTEGATDTYLPAVDATVPNVMQVLGLEPSCFAPPREGA